MRGAWERLCKASAQGPDLEEVLLDATISQAHADATSRKGGLRLMRSAAPGGGLTAMIDAVVDALGLEVALRDHAGARARPLVAGLEGLGHVVAEAAHDADPVRRFITDERGATPRIKQNPTRAGPQPIAWALHKERPVVERFFDRIKRLRPPGWPDGQRIALSREKTVASFRAFVALARAIAWLA